MLGPFVSSWCKHEYTFKVWANPYELWSQAANEKRVGSMERCGFPFRITSTSSKSKTDDYCDVTLAQEKKKWPSILHILAATLKNNLKSTWSLWTSSRSFEIRSKLSTRYPSDSDASSLSQARESTRNLGSLALTFTVSDSESLKLGHVPLSGGHSDLDSKNQ